MILRDAVNDYIAWRQAHGAKFDTGAYLLHRFLKPVGGKRRLRCRLPSRRSRLPCR